MRRLPFQKVGPQPQEGKETSFCHAAMETVFGAVSSIWKVPLKYLELNLPIGVPVVYLWDKILKPIIPGSSLRGRVRAGMKRSKQA